MINKNKFNNKALMINKQNKIKNNNLYLFKIIITYKKFK